MMLAVFLLNCSHWSLRLHTFSLKSELHILITVETPLLFVDVLYYCIELRAVRTVLRGVRVFYWVFSVYFFFKEMASGVYHQFIILVYHSNRCMLHCAIYIYCTVQHTYTAQCNIHIQTQYNCAIYKRNITVQYTNTI